MKRISAAFLAVLLATGTSGSAEPPMVGGVGGTLSWRREKETQTPEPEYHRRGGIVGKVEEVREKIEKVGEGGIVKETFTARLALAFKVRVIHSGTNYWLKLRWREDSWSISANTPGEDREALESDRTGLELRLRSWERDVTRAEKEKLEKGEAIPVSIADAYRGLQMLGGELPKLEARWGAYEITGFSLKDESYQNKKDLDDKIRAAEAKLKEAVGRHKEELDKLTKLNQDNDAAKGKAAEKKFELDHARNMRDYDPEIRKKNDELRQTGKECLEVLLTLGKEKERIRKLKKTVCSGPNPTDEDLAKALPPESDLRKAILRRNELQARLVQLDQELEEVRKKLDPKYKVDKLEAEYAALLKAVGKEEDARKQAETVTRAVTEADARFQELSDLKLEAEKARALSPLRFREVVVAGSAGELYRARVQLQKELEEELADCNRRLKVIKEDLDDCDAARKQAREDALEAGRKEIEARASWEVWFYNSSSYLSQAAVALGIEVYDVAMAARKGGAAGMAAEILKKAGERIVSGIVFGKWGEEYKEADPSKNYSLPELDSKFAKETAGMSTAKGLLGQTLEASGELPWEEFVKKSKFFHEIKPHLTSLKDFKAGAAGFAKAGAKKAVGEMLADGLIKDRIKDNLEQVLVNYLDDQAVQVYAEAEVRARAAIVLWMKTVGHFQISRAAYLTQLKKRDDLARRIADKAFTDVVTNKRFLDGESLTLQLVQVEEKSSFARKVVLALGKGEAIRSGKNLYDYAYRLEATDLNEECQGGVELKAVIKE